METTLFAILILSYIVLLLPFAATLAFVIYVIVQIIREKEINFALWDSIKAWFKLP